MSFILETNITQSRIWYTFRVDLIVVMAYMGQVLVGDFKIPGFLGRVFKNVQNWHSTSSQNNHLTINKLLKLWVKKSISYFWILKLSLLPKCYLFCCYGYGVSVFKWIVPMYLVQNGIVCYVLWNLFFVVGVGKLHLSEMQVVNRTRYCKDATLKQSTHEKDFFSIRLVTQPDF